MPASTRASALLIACLIVAGCGSSGSVGSSGPVGSAGQAGPAGSGTATLAPGTAAATQPAAGGAGNNRGWDCAALITPAELDQISGYTGGTVDTTVRGDQNPDQPGYGECSFDEPDAPSTWSGTFVVWAGAAVDGFDVSIDFDRSNGGTTDLPGLGTEAILVRTDAGTQILAKSTDGVGITVALTWDPTVTKDDVAIAALKQIARTVLSRV